MLNISRAVKRIKTVKKIGLSVKKHKKEYKDLLMKGWKTLRETKTGKEMKV